MSKILLIYYNLEHSASVIEISLSTVTHIITNRTKLDDNGLKAEYMLKFNSKIMYSII